MDAASWHDDEMRIQNDHLRQQLAAMRTKPAVWKRLRLLEVPCEGCGDLLLEVMDTEPYAAVCIRRPVRRPGSTSIPEGAPVAAYISRMLEGPAITRRGERFFYPLAKPFAIPPQTGPRVSVSVSCRCREVPLSERKILELLTSGVKKWTCPAPTGETRP